MLVLLAGFAWGLRCGLAAADTTPEGPRGGALGDFAGANVGDAVEVYGHLARKGSGTADAAAGVGLRVEVMLLPACAGNTVDAATSKDASCPQALLLCGWTAVPDDLMFWRFERVGTGPWRRAGGVCLRPDQAPAGRVPAFTVADFRRLPLPAGMVHVQPVSGRTLVNVATNVYVTARAVRLGTSLVGQPVRVRATPTGYRWMFGDGAVLATTDPGGPYPGMTTTHVYRIPGRVPLTLVTRYRGEYSIAGGPWLPVDGEAEVSSPAVPVTVLATRNELVSGPMP